MVKPDFPHRRPRLEIPANERLCPKCKVPMGAGSSREAVTYYYCPNSSCDNSKKFARPPAPGLETAEIPIPNVERR